uniref:Transcription factor n=1 Tax=Rhizophora mucronata TaxID=61149 RepID=A0A2P2JJI2_RHIMU
MENKGGVLWTCVLDRQCDELLETPFQDQREMPLNRREARRLEF